MESHLFDTHEMRDAAFKQTQEIIEKFGPRFMGTESCKNAANYLSKFVSKFATTTELMKFTAHPHSFLGWIDIMVYISFISFLLLMFHYTVLASILLLYGTLAVLFQFILYKEFIDPLFPKKEGYNVIGTIEPTGKVESTVILSGHHDSAQIFTFLDKCPDNYASYSNNALIAYFSLFLIVIIDHFYPLSIYIRSLSIIACFFTYPLLEFASKEISLGAGDNLISSCSVFQVGKHFAQAENRLKNTRIIVASFDGEEVGLRGARSYFKEFDRIRKENKDESKVWHYNIDCPYLKDQLLFLTSDINGTVKLSEKMANHCLRIATDLGYQAKAHPIEFMTGATDAGESGKIPGIEVTSELAMPWSHDAHYACYHTHRDTIESIEKDAIDQTLNIILNFIEQVENKTIH
ncbi:hypothetical protein M9Y10_006854 [Tritrichomonas musculus]|uniref:Peptidase M28 domain-containing protein n=1 Tax=Tritrichomonas musculus TaxID=1915356 RepID=A0ABR2JFR0_9EUKA